jgi:hypothetical protein
MKTIIAGLVVCTLSTLVIGCHSIGNSLSKITGNRSPSAKIYVLRRLSVTGSGRITVMDNGKQVGTIDRGGSLTWERPPGTAVVTVSHGDSQGKETVTVQANQVYYLEVRATHATAGHPKVVELHILSSTEGQHLLNVLQHEFGG